MKKTKHNFKTISLYTVKTRLAHSGARRMLQEEGTEKQHVEEHDLSRGRRLKAA